MSDDVRVLVVDDSAVMRAIIRDRVSSAPGLSIVGLARNGRQAIEAVESLHPDVITLDVRMPDMDGLDVLETILQRHPTPVVMVSAWTYEGASVTLEALQRGAVECVAKPGANAEARAAFAEELIETIRMAAKVNVRRMMSRRSRQKISPTPSPAHIKPAIADCLDDIAEICVAIGVSTGGPPALDKLLRSLMPPMPPLVIVQHMPPQFTGPLAARLDGVSPLSVREAEAGDVLRPNCVLIAPGGKHLELVRRGQHVKAVISDGPPVSGHKPSVDVMMTSAARVFGPHCLGVIMTGMGRDGVEGCRAIRAAGGFVLGQDEATSDVYGMNKAAMVEGQVDRQFPLQDAAETIKHRVCRMSRTLVEVH